ncbi:hypothetical protein DFH06DRAFT_1111036 [Mycena polygramma]|nr:hypothetical protein DFH06DRAFT_1111036 [Mycena polygramma]
MSSGVTQLPALDGTLGAVEVGVLFGTFLFGIATLQAFNYYVTFPKDTIHVKALVAFVWLLELGHTICSLHATYSVTVTFYGQLEHLEKPPLTLNLISFFSGLLTMTIQTFFAFRVHAVSGRWRLAAACCVSNVVALVLQLVGTAHVIESGGFPSLTGKARWMMIANSALIPATNIAIALSLCYSLWQHQTHNGFPQTRSMVVILMVWALETSAITSAASFMQLILFLTRSDLVWVTFFLIHGKLLSNAMLASLNGRKRFRAVNTESAGIIGSTISTRERNVTVIQMNQITETSSDIPSRKDGAGSHGESTQL